jgi:peroxiredoxin
VCRTFSAVGAEKHFVLAKFLGEHLMLKVGAKAPEFTLASDEGKEISLKDYQGRRVLLFFFPKANTPG